jgi:hypothetical protein
MKANRQAARRTGEVGVSSVLGAILVFGLFVITLVTIQVKFVPEWDRDREAALMNTVQQQLASLKADLDRQADNRTSVPVTGPLKLADREGFRFFSGGGLPADLAFGPPPGGGGFSLTSPQIRILSRDGTSTFGGNENWITVASGGSITSIAAINNLRLRVINPATYSTGDSVTLNLVGPGNAYAGKILLRNIDHGNTYTFELQTFASASPTTPSSITQHTFNKQLPPQYQYLNLLDPVYQFANILASASKPLDIHLTRFNMNADYTASYLMQVGNGTVPVGNPGITVPNYSLQQPGGSLQVQARNSEFVRQTYTMEHGAVILAQPEGSIMLVPPQFSARVVAGQVSLSMVMPAMTGSAATVTGPSLASVTLTPAGSRTDLVATAARLAISLSTASPAVWSNFWTETLQAAGLTNTGADPQFSTTTNSTTATLNLFGLNSAPSSTVDDVVLTIKSANIEVTTRAAGTTG